MTTPTTPTAQELIAAERQRQVDAEGYTPEHDAEHDDDALAMAAVIYALPADERGFTEFTENFGDVRGHGAPVGWPWPSEYWKPSPDDRVRELVKAGALIAAEIDRLLANTTTEES